MTFFTRNLIFVILSTTIGHAAAYADVCGTACAVTERTIQCDCYAENDGQLTFIDSVLGSNQRGSDAYSVAETACEARAWKYGLGVIKDCRVLQRGHK